MGVSANTIDFSDLEFKYEGIEQKYWEICHFYTQSCIYRGSDLIEQIPL